MDETERNIAAKEQYLKQNSIFKNSMGVFRVLPTLDGVQWQSSRTLLSLEELETMVNIIKRLRDFRDRGDKK